MTLNKQGAQQVAGLGLTNHRCPVGRAGAIAGGRDQKQTGVSQLLWKPLLPEYNEAQAGLICPHVTGETTCKQCSNSSCELCLQSGVSCEAQQGANFPSISRLKISNIKFSFSCQTHWL